ncbi:MAG TPA: LCP family protein [Firmicutes bacterium]|jgi:LCP family protein required for cell wall assembly|nr:LCP family protein [Bacillota bacterium]
MNEKATGKLPLRAMLGLMLLFTCLACLPHAYYRFNPETRFRAGHFEAITTPGHKVAESDFENKVAGDPQGSGNEPEQSRETPKAEEVESKGNTALRAFPSPDFNMLILGIDARQNEPSRSDVMILANIDPQTRKVVLISIPRDTKVEIPGVGYTKINHAHFLGEIKGGNHAGTMASLQAASNLLNCDIHCYVKVNFQGFKSFIDSIGGVDLELKEPVKLTFAGVTLPAETQKLDGDTALKLVRERFSLPDGDFGRQKLQYLVLQALAEKLLAPKYIPRIPELITEVRHNVLDTNLTDTDAISLAWMFKGISSGDVTHLSIPGHPEYAFDPLVESEVYYWVPETDKAAGLLATAGP